MGDYLSTQAMAAAALLRSLPATTRAKANRAVQQQQLYEEDEQGQVWLLVPFEGRVHRASPSLSLSLARRWTTLLPYLQVLFSQSPSSHASDKLQFPLLPAATQSKPNLDQAFLRQIKSILLRIVFPPATLCRNKEFGIVLMHSGFLVLRTVLSIMVARLDGRIVRDLASPTPTPLPSSFIFSDQSLSLIKVRADRKGFIRGLALWFLLAIPSTLTNSMVRIVVSTLHTS